jgi:hypothetical protein
VEAISTKRRKRPQYLHQLSQPQQEKKMNPALLINIIQSLVMDKAQSLAVEHVTKAIDDNLNDTQKKMLDYVVEEMPDNSFKSIKDLFG